MASTSWDWVPNALSVSRLALGLAFPFLPAGWRLWAVAVAALTDLLDGLAARWLHAESETGRLLDPVADKVFVLMLVGTLVAEGALAPGWAVGVAARDVAVVAAAAVIALRGRVGRLRRMKPRWSGKCATAAQFALLLVLVAGWPAPVWLLAATAGLSVAAAADYARHVRRL